MDQATVVLYLLLGLGITYKVLDTYVLEPRRIEKVYGAEWRAYNAGAFAPIVQSLGPGKGDAITRVGIEMQSDGGKYAVVMEHGGTGRVVHEFTRDGTFSSRGPYYIKLRPCIWAPTGRLHIVETVRPPAGIPTSNPSGGNTKEVGRRVVTFNTDAHPTMTLREYANYRSSLTNTLARLRING